jgi:hypothetical protein
MSETEEKQIPDAARLLRRIHPDQYVYDANRGERRCSTAAFKDQEMSVDVEDFLMASGKTWEASLSDYPSYGLARFPAEVPRSRGLEVRHVPLPDNDAHAEVHGKKTGSVASALQKAAELLRPPQVQD